MFHYRTDKNMYYIKANKKKWEFWAFSGIFCKKRYMWDVDENKQLEADFPGSEYCYGFTKWRIMIIGSKWLVKSVKR